MIEKLVHVRGVIADATNPVAPQVPHDVRSSNHKRLQEFPIGAAQYE